MSMFTQFKTDQTAEEQGVPCDFGDGLIISIRSMHCRKLRTLNARLAKKNAPHYRNGGQVPDAVQDEDDIERAVALVSGWEGATDEQGKPMEYSAENVRRAMGVLWPLRDRVIGLAAMSETFRAADVEADTANLSAASGTSSTSPAPAA